jgi:hypothetical protein
MGDREIEKTEMVGQDTERHWEYGIKYALEGIKTALLLNGAAAIALMTFSNTHRISWLTIWALILFAAGSALSAITFVLSYRTEILYGNAYLKTPGDQTRINMWKQAQRWNTGAVVVVLLSVVLFLVGGVFTGIAIFTGDVQIQKCDFPS